jgi:Tol biopolymer transport system component
MRISSFLGLLVLVALSGCTGITSSIPTQTTPLSFPPPTTTVHSTATQRPSSIPLPHTSTPSINFQLTFISDNQSIYGINIGCLENEGVCLGEPQLLMNFPDQGGGPRIPDFHSWSQDGSRLAVCAVGVGGWDDIFWTSINDISWTNITNSELFECYPNWMPDGQRLVYEANSYDVYGGSRIFSTMLTGEDAAQLLSLGNLGDEEQIALSPDGNQLAFIHSDDNGFYQLFMADLDGSNRVQLTDLPAHHFLPDFSPNGEWLVFTRVTDPYSPTDLRTHIVIMNLTTKENTILISGINENEGLVSPAWSPFGNWIAFVYNVEGSSDIYLIRIDGKGFTHVTTNPGNESDPEWRVINTP